MSESVDDKGICKYNQTGFCKFRANCKKVHNNEVCNDESDCRSETCTKRHPKVCKNFKHQGYCRHKDQCSYRHIEHINVEKLKDILLQIHAKNLEESNHLRVEINKLKDKVDKLEEYINTQSTNTEKVIESEKDTATVDNYEKWYNCSMCDYRVKKEITLQKHINTKHSRKDTLDGIASDGLAASYFCDECEYSCHNKKSLKKHKSHNQKGVGHRCNTCAEKFKNKKDLDSHVKDMHVCICTDTTVCDKCLHEDEWVY